MSKIVIALGGNALGKTPFEQLELLTNVSKIIVKLVSDMSEGSFILDKDYAMINMDTGKIYDNNDIIINTELK